MPAAETSQGRAGNGSRGRKRRRNPIEGGEGDEGLSGALDSVTLSRGMYTYIETERKEEYIYRESKRVREREMRGCVCIHA